MNRADAAAMARSVLDDHGLSDWSVTFTRHKRALGVCRFQTRTIGLSGPLTDCNGPDVVSDTIRHEVAHALAGPAAGHGPEWRAMCAVTGARPQACADARRDGIATVPPRYRVMCPRCGDIGGRHKLPPRGRTYGCGRCRSAVTFERSAA